MNWKRQTFTFMVIPDANSQVVRFRLSGIVVLAALVSVILLAITAVTALVLSGTRSGEVARLKQQMAAAAVQYEQMLADRQRHIDELQTEVAGLSDQAKSIQDRMENISKLESELKELTGMEPLDAATALVPLIEEGDYAMEGEGTGGEELPVPPENFDELLEETQHDFSSIEHSMDELLPRLEATKDFMERLQATLRVTPTIWPTDSRKISSPFGVRKDPFTRRTRFHSGIDISGQTGDPVYATADGTVTFTGWDKARGNHIILSHGNGIQTKYEHLSKITAETGSRVRKGDVIGLMGSTGRSTGPHLHYEVVVKNEQVDPLPYLKTSRKDNP
jgi:type II secretory pathway pseudopilin PulG